MRIRLQSRAWSHSCASIHIFVVACVSYMGHGRNGSRNVAVNTIIAFATMLTRGTR